MKIRCSSAMPTLALIGAVAFGAYGCSSSSDGDDGSPSDDAGTQDGSSTGSGGKGSGGKGSGGSSAGGAATGGAVGSGGAGTGGVGSGGADADSGSGGTGGGGSGGSAAEAGAEACAPDVLAAPTVPAAIEAPAGVTLLMGLHATGDQVYTCKGTAGVGDAGMTYAWTLKEPDATLSNGCESVGTHFLGPTWKSSADQSAVVGARLASAAAPVAGAVPWLLLQKVSTSGTGIFSSVTYIHRVDTVGGVAPTTDCAAANADEEVREPYTANYFFYSGPPVTDAGPG